MSNGSKFLQAGRQQAHAMVLDIRRPKDPQSKTVIVELQVIGGGIEMIFPKQDEAKAAGIQKGATIVVDVTYVPYGKGTETKEGSNGKPFTDRFDTYRMRVFLPRHHANEADAA